VKHHQYLQNKYLGTAVLWHDEHDNSVGPGEVISITPKDRVLVLEFSTGLYHELWPMIDAVEVIKFSDEQYEALPENIRNEISIATCVGPRCGYDNECGQRRLFGHDYCEEHTVQVEWPEHDPRDDIWADNDGLVGKEVLG
jgi:hypothetical protein